MAFVDYVGDERLKGLYSYWLKHWNGNKLPGRQDIDPIAMGAAVLPLLLLTEIVPREGAATACATDWSAAKSKRASTAAWPGASSTS